MARYGTVMPKLQMLSAAYLQPSAITADMKDECVCTVRCRGTDDTTACRMGTEQPVQYSARTGHMNIIVSKGGGFVTALQEGGVMTASRVGPIYRLADILGRYRYIGIVNLDIGNLDIGIGHIGVGISYSGYRLYRYRPNIG